MAWRDHRPFLVLLVLGTALRVVVQLSFPPAFVFSDGPGYLGLVDDLVPLTDRVVGYGVLLDALAWLSRGVWLVAVVQPQPGVAPREVRAALSEPLRRMGTARPDAVVLARIPLSGRSRKPDRGAAAALAARRLATRTPHTEVSVP